MGNVALLYPIYILICFAKLLQIGLSFTCARLLIILCEMNHGGVSRSILPLFYIYFGLSIWQTIVFSLMAMIFNVGFPIKIQSLFQNLFDFIFYCPLFYVSFSLRTLIVRQMYQLKKQELQKTFGNHRCKENSRDIVIVDDNNNNNNGNNSNNSNNNNSSSDTSGTNTIRKSANENSRLRQQYKVEQLQNISQNLQMFLFFLFIIIFDIFLLLISQFSNLENQINQSNFFNTPYNRQLDYLTQIIMFCTFFLCFYSMLAHNKSYPCCNKQSNTFKNCGDIEITIWDKIEQILVKKQRKQVIVQTQSPTIGTSQMDNDVNYLFESRTMINTLKLDSLHRNTITYKDRTKTNSNTIEIGGYGNVANNQCGFTGLQLLQLPSICLSEEPQTQTQTTKSSVQNITINHDQLYFHDSDNQRSHTTPVAPMVEMEAPFQMTKKQKNVFNNDSNCKQRIQLQNNPVDFGNILNSDLHLKSFRAGTSAEFKAIVYDFQSVFLSNSHSGDMDIDNEINKDSDNSSVECKTGDFNNNKFTINLFGGYQRIEMLSKHLHFVSSNKNCLLFLLCENKLFGFEKLYSILNKIGLIKYFIGSTSWKKINSRNSLMNDLVLSQRIHIIKSKSKSRLSIIVSIIKYLNLGSDQLLYIDSDPIIIKNICKFCLCCYYLISNCDGDTNIYKNKSKNKYTTHMLGLQLKDILFIQQRMR